jgi:hypothetical protein
MKFYRYNRTANGVTTPVNCATIKLEFVVSREVFLAVAAEQAQDDGIKAITRTSVTKGVREFVQIYGEAGMECPQDYVHTDHDWWDEADACITRLFPELTVPTDPTASWAV